MDYFGKMECALTELRACAPVLVRLADEIEGLTRQMQALIPEDKRTYAKPEEQPKAPETPAPTMEQLRGLLARKSAAGQTEAVRAILLKYGAVKLSELPEFNYADVMAEAEVLPDAS